MHSKIIAAIALTTLTACQTAPTPPADLTPEQAEQIQTEAEYERVVYRHTDCLINKAERILNHMEPYSRALDASGYCTSTRIALAPFLQEAGETEEQAIERIKVKDQEYIPFIIEANGYRIPR